MCMKNVDATLDIEVFDENENILTEESGYCKVIPIKDNINLYYKFYSCVINGKDKFFDEQKKLFFEIRLTDKRGGTYEQIANFDFELSKDENYYVNNYVDFMIHNEENIISFDVNKYSPSEEYFIAILVKTLDEWKKNNPWTVQSCFPIKFKKAVEG